MIVRWLSGRWSVATELNSWPQAAAKLYGPKSSEGKLWTKMLAMLIVLGVGVAASDGQATTHRFAIFVIIGFLLMAWGIIEKIQDSGLRPNKKDIAYASGICMAIFMFRSDTSNSSRNCKGWRI